MIAKLTGQLDETGADWAVIDVQGVGYLVHCSSKTLAALGLAGDEVTVFTDLQVPRTTCACSASRKPASATGSAC
jgi:Holliday junction DNA helicase RuvA